MFTRSKYARLLNIDCWEISVCITFNISNYLNYIFQLTQPVDDVSTQKACSTKHCCRYSTGGGASSFTFGDDSMVKLPLLDFGDGGS